MAGYFDEIIMKGNYVEDFWEDPCDAPVTAYAITALAAFLIFIVAYFGIDWKQIVMAWSRPAKVMGKLRSRPKIRVKTRKGGPNWFIRWLRRLGDDPYDAIGRNLPWAREMRSRYVSDGIAHLWVFEGRIERLLYWMMMVELVNDFLYNWASGMMASKFCQKADDSVFLASQTTYTTAALFGWTALLYGNIEKQRGGIEGSSGSITFGNLGNPAVIATCTPIYNPDWPNATLTLEISAFPGGQVLASGQATSNPMENKQIMLHVNARSARSYLIRTRLSEGFCFVADSRVYAHAQKALVEQPPI